MSSGLRMVAGMAGRMKAVLGCAGAGMSLKGRLGVVGLRACGCCRFAGFGRGVSGSEVGK
jgi:hypothetical protein